MQGEAPDKGKAEDEPQVPADDGGGDGLPPGRKPKNWRKVLPQILVVQQQHASHSHSSGGRGGAHADGSSVPRPLRDKSEVYLCAFLSLSHISVPDQTFTVTGYFNYFWIDSTGVVGEIAAHAEKQRAQNIAADGRVDSPLAFSRGDSMSAAHALDCVIVLPELGRALVPMYKSNMIHNATNQEVIESRYTYHPKTGVVHVAYRIRAECHEYFELGSFPFDRQFLSMQLTGHRRRWTWLTECPDWVPASPYSGVTYTRPLNVRQSESLMSVYRLFPSWVRYNSWRILFRMRVERKVGYYFTTIFLPMCLIVVACFSSLAVPSDQVGDRLSVSVTLFLAAIAYQYVIHAMLPPTSTISEAGGYVMLTFAAIALLILENSLAAFVTQGNADTMDLVSLVVLGTVWLLVNLRLILGSTHNKYFTLRQDWVTLETKQSDGLEKNWVHDTRQYVIKNWMTTDPVQTIPEQNYARSRKNLHEVVQERSQQSDFWSKIV